jgi:inorganic pyrophosphatase
MNVNHIPAFKGKHINVIIETPLGSCFKYAYDPSMDVMIVNHQLPKGYFFAFNFGFIPNTLAEDGDPLDVIVYSDEHCLSGALIQCRVVGALIARQKKDSRTIHNDRIIAVPAGTKVYDTIKKVSDIDNRILREYENFFVSYENYRGVAFNVVKWVSPVQAISAVKKSLTDVH